MKYFLQAVKEFQVSLYQALVLLLFNQQNDLGYKDIQEQTKIRMSHPPSPIHIELSFQICRRS